MKLKKWLIAGGLLAAGTLFVGSKYFSYAKNELTKMVEQHTATPEREIERLREEVKKLDKVEKDIKDELASEMVLCEKMAKQTAGLRTQVNAERTAVLALADEIRGAAGKVSIGKNVYSIDDAKRKLKGDTNAVAQREKTLNSLESTLAHREESKTLLKKQLEEVQIMKMDLTNELDAIEVEFKALKLQAMQNKHTRDDSKWSEVRDGIEKLKEKVQVKKVRVGLDTGKGKIDGPISESVDDIVAPLTGGKKDAGEKSGE